MDKLIAFLEYLRQALLPRKVLWREGDSLVASVYREGVWQRTQLDELPENGLFGQTVFLLPDSATLFRLREYPVSHVRRPELPEAIELDVATWSPWEEPVDMYYLPSIEGDHWRIAVWIWPKKEVENDQDLGQAGVTHVMPDVAWRIAALKRVDRSILYVDDRNLVSVSSSGVPLHVSRRGGSQSVSAALRRLDEAELELPVVVEPGCDCDELPSAMERLPYRSGLPNSRALSYARLENVSDWTDPVSWRKPLAMICGFYFVWLLASTAILWQKADGLSEQVAEARRSANEVIEQRERVTSVHDLLAELGRLRAEQSRFENTLAIISQHLPEDAWIEALDYNAEGFGTLDLAGKSESSARLAALFEALPQIQHAMFLGDIRREGNTGLEPFQLRLTLAEDQ